MKKAAMLGVLCLSHGLDWVLHEGNAMFFTAVCWMYISNESLSLLENLALCGVPVPARLKAMLEKLSAQEPEGVQTPLQPQGDAVPQEPVVSTAKASSKATPAG